MTSESLGKAAQPDLYSDRATVTGTVLRCSSCGQFSASNSVKLCERCLFSAAIEPDEKIFPPPVALQNSAQSTRLLGRYVLLEEIGRGGMGVIYRGVDQQTCEIVAIKTVLPEDVGNREVLERFRREATTVQRLDHPHCLPIHEVGCSEEGIPFFSMKLAAGGSLYHLGAKYRGRWRQIAALMVKIASAVHHAHELGIVHRDLKPGNILFDEDQEPLVADFGLAKQLTDPGKLTQTYAVLGTPHYVSPEQAAGKTRNLTRASDIYSLGAILFELLTGRPPFVGDNVLDVLMRAAAQTPIRPRGIAPTIPKALETICMRCLERRPEDRYASSQDLVDDLESWLHGHQISSRFAYGRLRKVLRLFPRSVSWYCAVVGLVALLWMARMTAIRSMPPVAKTFTMAVSIEDLSPDLSLEEAARKITFELGRRLALTCAFEMQQEGAAGADRSVKMAQPSEFGRAMHVQYLLSGSVRRVDESVRLTTRILRCETGQVVWRHTDSISTRDLGSKSSLAAEEIISTLERSLGSDASLFLTRTEARPSPAAQALFTRGKELAARTNQKDLQSAVVLFQQAADADPHFSSARAMLGFALWAQADRFGQVDKLPLAMDAARMALSVDPNSAQAHRVIASCYFKTGNYDGALEEFWQAAESNPESAGCYQSLGMCLREMGRSEQAIRWLKRAVDLDGAHGEFVATLGELLALCGHDREAELALQRGIAIDADQPDSHVILAALRTWQKSFGEARGIGADVRERFPDSRIGPSLMAWIDLCDGRMSDAERDFESLRKENSYDRDWEFYGAINPASALAYLAKKAGLVEKANVLAREAFEVDRNLLAKCPHNPRVLHDMAATSAVLDETEQAMNFLEQSISSGWAEPRSTEIDPRFSKIAELPRFKDLLKNAFKRF